MLARRDTRLEAARLRRLSPLQTVEDQSQTWGIRCHSCTEREGLPPSWQLSYKTYVLRFTRESRFSFNQRIARYSYSRWTDHSVHLCFRTPRARFPRTRLLSHVPVVISTLPVVRTTGWAGDLGFGASPSRGIAPSRFSVGLALLQHYSLRSRTHDRPHVSISEALPSALASCGILSDTPYGWHL